MIWKIPGPFYLWAWFRNFFKLGVSRFGSHFCLPTVPACLSTLSTHGLQGTECRPPLVMYFSHNILVVLVASQFLCTVSSSSSTSWLSQCTAEGHGELKHLYVSTLDGKLSALDSTGKRQWRYKFSQPLYSSSISYSEPDAQFPNLIPGLDKKLYHWDGVHLMPLSPMEDLVEDDIDNKYSSSRLGVIRVGGKTKEDVALDVATGKPLYHCSQFNCHKYDNHSQIGSMDRLLVSAHRTTVREADGLSGEEIWNFTVSRLQLLLLEGERSADEDISCQLGDGGSSDWIFNVDSTEGVLFVSNSVTEISWNFKFPSPIMDVWFHHGGKLEKVFLSPLQHPSETKPVLLLGVWHNQYYIQPTTDRPFLQPWNTRLAENFHGYGNEDLCSMPAHPTYTPTLPSNSHDDTRVTLYNQQHNWLNELSTHGPNGLALYFHPIDSNSDRASCYRELENTSDDETTPTNQESFELESSGYFTMAYEYSRSVLRYAIFAVVVLAVNKLRRYHSRQRSKRKRLTTDSSLDGDDEVFRLPDELGPDSIVPLVFGNSRRPSGSSSTIKPSPTYDLLPIQEEETAPQTNKSESNDSVGSRFDTEYEFLGVLGKGGFGLVYHVKNKTDNIEYALKRIKLPEKKFAREKVMREVHALAQLDHPHIVRYFNSWVEKAPPGWNQREEWVPLSKVNSLLKMEDLSTSKPSTPSRSPSRPVTSSSSSATNGSSMTSSSLASNNGGTLVTTNGSIPLSSFQTFTPDLPPLSKSDSHSSFTIEFGEDSQSRLSSDEGERSNSPISISVLNASSITKSSSSADDYCHKKRTTQTGSNEPSSNDHPESPDAAPSHSDVWSHPSRSSTPSFVFIQMQLCQKESLKDWLRKNIHNRRRIEVCEMFGQILNAVVYVHKKGLMHRDLKPSNIFFSPDGRIKVGDFGLVTGHVVPDTHNNSFNVLKHLGQDSDGTRHTGNIGTHFYVSPEQMMGLEYDQKVDIFSLGVILFEMNHPFTTEMERAKVLEDVRKSKFPTGFKKHLQHEAAFVEWLMSSVAKRPTVFEVCASGRLEDLKEMIIHSDFSYIPKL